MPEVVRELVAKLGYEVDTSGLEQWDQGVGEAREGTEALGDSAEETEAETIAMGVAMGNAVTKLAELGVQAVATAGKFAIELVTGFAESGDEIAKTSRQIGVSTDSLQELRFAAERAGVSQASLDKSLKQVQIGLIDAKTKGTGPFVEGLDLLGIALEDLEGLDTTEQMGLIADALIEVGDEADKTAASAKLFGARAGVELKTLLEGGSAGLADMANEANRLGGVLGEDALKSAEGLADSFTNLDTLTEGLKNRIGGALAPAVEGAINTFVDWVAANDELISQDLPDFIELVIQAGQEFLPVLIDVAVETKRLFIEIKQLDERLTDDFGPAWDFIKVAMEGALVPIRAISNGIDGINETLDTLERKLPLVAKALRLVAGTAGGPAAGAVLGGEGGGVQTTTVRGLGKETEFTKGAREQKAKAGEREDNAQARFDRDTERKDFARQALLAKSQRIESSNNILKTLAPRARGKDRREIQSIAEKVRKGEITSRDGRRQALALAGGSAGGVTGGRKGGGGGKKAAKAAPTAEELVADFGAGAKAGAGRAAAGGGASPLAGATITTINAPFTDNTTINIDLGSVGLDSGTPGELGDVVAEAVEIQNREKNRRIIDHLSQTPRT